MQPGAYAARVVTPLAHPRPVREAGAIDRHRFDSEIRPAREPVVLRGLAADWPAVQAGREGAAAIVAYCKRFSHDRPVSAIVGDPAIHGRFFYNDDLTGMNFVRGVSPLDPFLDRLLRECERSTGYAMAVQSMPAPALLPGFTAENAIQLVDDAVAPRLWLGNKLQVAAHYDLMENVSIVVAGRRSNSRPRARRQALSTSLHPISSGSRAMRRPRSMRRRQCSNPATRSTSPFVGGTR